MAKSPSKTPGNRSSKKRVDLSPRRGSEGEQMLLFMDRVQIPRTLENYLELIYFGEKTLEDLDAEELAEIPEELLKGSSPKK